jgi:hypothetical protein
VKLSPGCTEEEWKAAFDGPEDWDTAINIVEDRIKGRWLDAADQLQREPHSGFGFAILALDCIVLESLWGFMNGKPTPLGQGEQVYRDILTGPHFEFTKAQSDGFLAQVRHGIMHDAETRRHWLIEKTIPAEAILRRNKGGYILNRTKFHEALNATFVEWIANLRHGHVALRANMRRRMDQIVAKHHK